MEYVCKHCNKKYKSSHSRSNHYRIYHNNDVKENVKVCKDKTNMCKDKVKVFNNNDVTKDSLRYSCNYCNKIFKSRQYRWEHQNKFCKIKKTDELKEENTTIIELKRENLEIKNTLSELLKLCKIHPKTLQKINNNLINNSNINTGTVNNKTVNNKTVNIVKFGSEELNKILSESEILKMLGRKMCSLEESIKMIHFNDNRPEFKNIYITNLKDQYAYVYDGDKFTAVLKSDILEELVDNHFENIEYSAEEYKEKLEAKTIEVLDKFIDKMNNDREEFIDKEHKKKYQNFKNF